MNGLEELDAKLADIERRVTGRSTTVPASVGMREEDFEKVVLQRIERIASHLVPGRFSRTVARLKSEGI